MILLLAVFAGMAAGLWRARQGGKPYQPASLRYTWLLAVSMLSQGLVFYFPPARDVIPDGLAAVCLIGSQLGLLIFVWLNRQQPGLWVLGAGLAMNLLVIASNGGFMPISPEVASRLVSEIPETGLRFGWSKDIVLENINTRLWQMSDWLLLPAWFPGQVAFSPGDILIAIGAFSLLWQGEAGRKRPSKIARNLRWPSTRQLDHENKASGSLLEDSMPIPMNSPEMSRLISAALVDEKFCHLLLADPAVAIASGYNNEAFNLSPQEKIFVLTTGATSLTDLAARWVDRNNPPFTRPAQVLSKEKS